MIHKDDPSTYRELVPGIRMQSLAYGETTHMVKFLLDADAELPHHSHPHEQTGYLVSGHFILTIDGEPHDFIAGDSWSVAGGVPHSAQVLADTIIIEVFSPIREDYLPE